MSWEGRCREEFEDDLRRQHRPTLARRAPKRSPFATLRGGRYLLVPFFVIVAPRRVILRTFLVHSNFSGQPEVEASCEEDKWSRNRWKAPPTPQIVFKFLSAPPLPAH